MTDLERLARRTMRVAGAADLAIGLAVYLAPRRVLRAVGIDDQPSAPLLRILGAQSASVGAATIISASTDDLRAPAVVAGMAGRVANGVVLIGARRALGGSPLVIVLAGVEFGIVVAHLAAVLGGDGD